MPKRATEPSTLKNCPTLLEAVESFIRGNSTFESSVLIKLVVEAVADAQSLDAAFVIPIQKGLLNMDGALLWALFLDTAARGSVVEDAGLGELGALNLAGAFTIIRQVYDLGLEAAVLDHFGGDESEEEEESGENEEDEEGSEGASE